MTMSYDMSIAIEYHLGFTHRCGHQACEGGQGAFSFYIIMIYVNIIVTIRTLRWSASKSGIADICSS